MSSREWVEYQVGGRRFIGRPRDIDADRATRAALQEYLLNAGPVMVGQLDPTTALGRTISQGGHMPGFASALLGAVPNSHWIGGNALRGASPLGGRLNY